MAYQQQIWMGVLSTKYFYGEDDHTDYLKTLNAITAKDVQEFAKKFLAQGNEAVVILTTKK